jgi:hypothetical protein
MQLDRTAIVIAQRSADELLDLSLIVVRNYWAKLVPIALLGALPFALLNFILLRPITDYEQMVMASRDFTTTEGFHLRYLWTMVCLVFLQAPMAMAGVTYFLGQAVFIEEPSLKQVGGVLARRWFPMLLVIGIVRGALVSIGFSLWLYLNPVLYPEWRIVLYSVLGVVIFFLIRSFRPFAPEVILLERCPLRVSSKPTANEQSFAKRSSWLHASSGDLFSVQMGVSCISIIFILAMCAGSLFMIGVLIGVWQWGWWMDLIFFPLVLWMMAFWETVIRFLLYLNTRIRLEGWEVYLRLNAELQRLLELNR